MEGEAFYGDSLKKTIISNLILPEQNINKKKSAIFNSQVERISISEKLFH